MYRVLQCALAAGVAVALAACSPPSTSDAALESGLLQVAVDPFAVTVSGFGSGALMAQQFHLAHSERVRGVALIGAPPYGCAFGQEAGIASDPCGRAQPGVAIAQTRAAARQIQPLENLRNDHVWLMHGEHNASIDRSMFNTVVEFYRKFVDSDRITVEYVDRTGHLWPTIDYGVECSASKSPHLGACDYDAAELMLSALYGYLRQPELEEQRLTEFNQRMAVEPIAGAGLAERGYAYIPRECAAGASCSLHISFHGCEQSADFIGPAFAEHSGLNRWAEANRLVILYPQAPVSDGNPRGCWDGWGYTGADYATVDGVQIEALVQLINHIAGVDAGLADIQNHSL